MTKTLVSRRLLLIGEFGLAGTALMSATGCGHRTDADQSPAGHRGTSNSTPGSDQDSAPTSTGGSPTPTRTSPLTTAELTAKLEAYRQSRDATLGVALVDRHTGKTFGFHSSWRNEMVSLVKVLILATVLRRCQERSSSLSREQSALAFTMITRSDNDAANKLLTWAGVDQVRRTARLSGLTDTVIQGGTEDGESDWWGYSTTTPIDQLRTLANLVHGTRVITAANRDYLVRLMSQVVPAQRWGVCTPPLPTSVRWTAKNGWGERAGGYRANSIGHISGNGRDYDAVILARTPHKPAYTVERQYAFDTVSGVSRILYDALAHPIR